MIITIKIDKKSRKLIEKETHDNMTSALVWCACRETKDTECMISDKAI